MGLWSEVQAGDIIQNCFDDNERDGITKGDIIYSDQRIYMIN
jgi:hypothetical protein